MDTDETPAETTQQPKEFVALAHGQEWVTFYESFDKLVQDNLARSSELLRRAMTLPEVADREVAQVRAAAEAQLAAERQRNRDIVTSLQDELAGGIRQTSVLAQSVGSLMADLDRLNQRITTLLAEAAAAQASAEPSSASASMAESTLAPPPAAESIVTEEPPGEALLTDAQAAEAATDAITGTDSELNGTVAIDALEDEAPSDAAATDESTDQPETATDTAGRPRPNWLSVSRVNRS